MKKITFFMVLLSTLSCAQVENQKETIETKEITVKETKIPHKYGGWYCPDNLNGFPPVGVTEWANVPVINGRLPSKEETQTEASLIYIDKEEHPNAKVMDMKMPRLAKFYCEHSNKDEYVIVIQAIQISGDSVVGFRYLNGGNGSAHYSEVEFLSDAEAAKLQPRNFVTHSIKIENATQDRVWDVITNEEYLSALYPTFENNAPADKNWRKKTNANYYYTGSNLTGNYAGKLYGSFYVQNDYLVNFNPYVEKFLMLENREEKYTELKIVCGPYSLLEYENQKSIIENWAKRVKEIITEC